MLKNYSLLEKKICEKISKKAFEALINDIYISSLPFSINVLDNESKKNISKYTISVLESLGGFDFLKKRIESETDSSKKLLLKCMYNTCLESSQSAAKRIVNEKEKDIKYRDSSLEELVINSGFTKEELHDFMSKGNSIETDRLGEIIKNKVIHTLKEEQKAHQQVEKINSELMSVAMDNDDITDKKLDNDDIDINSLEEKKEKKAEESVQSFLKTLLHGNKNEHISLFSSIQEAACAQIIHSENIEHLDPNKISLRRINNITRNNTLSIFKTKSSDLETSLENLTSILSSLDRKNQMEYPEIITEAAMIDTIVVYTMLEALNTLNLLKIGVSDIKEAVESSHSLKHQEYSNIRDFNNALSNELYTAEKLSNSKNIENISEKLQYLEKLKDKIQKANMIIINSKNSEMLYNIINKLKNEKECLLFIDDKKNEPSIEKNFEVDICQFMRLTSLLKALPIIDFVNFDVFPETNIIGVRVNSPYGNKETHIELKNIDSCRCPDYLKKMIMDSGMLNYSNLKSASFILNIKDGYGKSFRLI